MNKMKFLIRFREQYGYLPEAGNASHAEELYQLTLRANASEFSGLGLSSETIAAHEAVIKRLSLSSRGVISPMCGPLNNIL